jgi:hypothetical protein
VQAVVDDYTRPAGRRMMTADLRALYPRDTEDQAVLRPLARKRTALPYEWARLAADALRVRAQAVRRADRLGSRTRPRTVAVLPPRGRARGRSTLDRKAGRVPEQTTDVDTVEQTRRTLAEAALARSRKAPGGVPSPTAPDRSPPRRRPCRRTPSSPAPGTHWVGPREESREHLGRTTQP